MHLLQYLLIFVTINYYKYNCLLLVYVSSGSLMLTDATFDFNHKC